MRDLSQNAPLLRTPPSHSSSRNCCHRSEQRRSVTLFKICWGSCPCRVSFPDQVMILCISYGSRHEPSSSFLCSWTSALLSSQHYEVTLPPISAGDKNKKRKQTSTSQHSRASTSLPDSKVMWTQFLSVFRSRNHVNSLSCLWRF